MELLANWIEMAQKLLASFMDLAHDATLRSFWRRKTLWRFLRQHGVSESFLSGWDTFESKRNFLDRLYTKLPEIKKGGIARSGNSLRAEKANSNHRTPMQLRFDADYNSSNKGLL